jgi:hypothetical protein
VLFSTHAGADFIQGNFVFFVVFAFAVLDESAPDPQHHLDLL